MSKKDHRMAISTLRKSLKRRQKGDGRIIWSEQRDGVEQCGEGKRDLETSNCC